MHLKPPARSGSRWFLRWVTDMTMSSLYQMRSCSLPWVQLVFKQWPIWVRSRDFCRAHTRTFRHVNYLLLLLYATQIQALSLCQCKVCVDCLQTYFSVQIRERHVKNLVCPVCQQPEIDHVDNPDTTASHFQFLDLMVCMQSVSVRSICICCRVQET